MDVSPNDLLWSHAMKVQYHDPPLDDMIDKEWRSALCDAQARLVSVMDPDDVVAKAAAPLGMWVTRAIVDVGVEPDGRTQLPSHACSEVKLVAAAANTHPIYIGDVTVSSANTCGTLAREGEIIPRMVNSNTVYVVAAAGHTGQKLHLQTR